MFNFIDIYSFITVSICVGRGPSALLWPGAYNAVKTAMPGTPVSSTNKTDRYDIADILLKFDHVTPMYHTFASWNWNQTSIDFV